MVNYLTNQDPSILNFRDKNGNTALHITMMYSKDPGNMAKFFIDNGLSAEAKNNNNLTPSEVGRKRIDDVKKKELEDNTEMFLEPFVTLGKAEEDKLPESEIVNNINSGITYLQKAHVNENQNLYKGFITPENNLQGPVNFDKYGCYPHANIEDQKECEVNGGQWLSYDTKEMTTFAKVDYEQTGGVNENTDPDSTPSPDDQYYYAVQVTPIPVKDLPPLDHDSIMNKPIPTPTLTSSPTSTPTSTPTPTSPSSSENVNEGFISVDNCSTYYYYLGMFMILVAIMIILYFIYSRVSKSL
jgi:hypothetical protein